MADSLYLPALMADQLGIARSKGRKLIEQGAVTVRGEAVSFEVPADTTGWLEVGTRRRLWLGDERAEQTKVRVGGKRYLVALPIHAMQRLVDEAKRTRLTGENPTLDARTLEGAIAFVSPADVVAAEEWQGE